MSQFALQTLAVLLMAATSAFGEDCSPISPTEVVLVRPSPDCEVRAGFEASFGKRGLTATSIVLKEWYTGFSGERWEYEVELRDDETARQIDGKDLDFKMTRQAFIAELKRSMCENPLAIEVLQSGGTLEFEVAFLLREPTDANSWRLLLNERARVHMTSCEAP
jgi:hypothetical protein